jgi:hypothetical protein
VTFAKQENNFLKRSDMSHVQVAHSCDPSYLGGYNQKDHGLRTAQANKETASTK